MKKLYFIFIFLFFFNLISATSVGTTDLTKGKVVYTSPSLPTNYSIKNTNSSDYWDDYDIPDDIIFNFLKIVSNNAYLKLGRTSIRYAKWIPYFEDSPWGTGNAFDFEFQFDSGESGSAVIFNNSGENDLMIDKNGDLILGHNLTFSNDGDITTGGDIDGYTLTADFLSIIQGTIISGASIFNDLVTIHNNLITNGTLSVHNDTEIDGSLNVSEDINVRGITASSDIIIEDSGRACIGDSCDWSWEYDSGDIVLKRNVGSGITKIESNLTVGGDNTLFFVSAGDSGTKSAIIRQGTITREWEKEIDASPYRLHYDYVGTDAPKDYIVTFEKEGLLGVNENDPEFTLDVGGGARIQGDLRVVDGSPYIYAFSESGTSGPEAKIRLGIVSDGTSPGSSGYWYYTDMKSYAAGGGGETIYTIKTRLSATEEFTANNGKVGILDTTPSYELDVNGEVNAVSGFRSGGTAGLDDSTSYWLCTADDCSSTCQVTISGGIITGCS